MSRYVVTREEVYDAEEDMTYRKDEHGNPTGNVRIADGGLSTKFAEGLTGAKAAADARNCPYPDTLDD